MAGRAGRGSIREDTDMLLEREKERRIERAKKLQATMADLHRLEEGIANAKSTYRTKLATSATTHGAEISELNRKQTQMLLELNSEAMAQAGQDRQKEVKTQFERIRRDTDKNLYDAAHRLQESLGDTEELRVELLQERMQTQALEADCEKRMRQLRADTELEKARARSDAAEHAQRLLGRLQGRENAGQKSSEPRDPKVFAEEADRELGLAEAARATAETQMTQLAQQMTEDHFSEAGEATKIAEAQLSELQKRRREVESQIIDQQTDLEREVAIEVEKIVKPHEIEVNQLENKIKDNSEKHETVIKELMRIALKDRARFEEECEREAERVVQTHRSHISKLNNNRLAAVSSSTRTAASAEAKKSQAQSASDGNSKGKMQALSFMAKGVSSAKAKPQKT